MTKSIVQTRHKSVVLILALDNIQASLLDLAMK